MDRTLILTLGGLLAISSARAELQLTPTLSEYEFDGVQMRQLVFHDGNKEVTYTPPRGWEYSGGGNRLVLRPAGLRAEAAIKVSRMGVPEVFDEATITRLSEELLTSLPAGATHISIVVQQKNPLLIEHKETLLIVMNYDFNNESCARSVMVLNRTTEQMRFELTCLRNDFPTLQKAFQGSQYSWQNL